MKKTKIITISLLGLLLLVPFMSPARAQVPSYIGVAVGGHYEWDQNLYVGAAYDTWNQWFADNMTYHWAGPFYQSAWDNMTTVYESSSWDPTPPQLNYVYDVDLILADTSGVDSNWDGIISTSETFPSPGRTLINFSAANVVPDYPVYTVYYPQTIVVGNDTAKFAEDSMYGATATSAFWLVNWNNYYFINPILFAPTNVNWTEYVALCNAGLEATYGISAYYGYTLTMTELTNGYTMSSPVMGFGNNSQTITLTTTYDSNGVMTYNSFEYGSNLLYEYVLLDLDDPVITDAPSDFSVNLGYTGVTINWTATDANPDDYAILQNGSAVVSPTSWTSGVKIEFDVPDGLALGDYLFRINLVDETGNLAYDEVIMTVKEAPPVSPPGIPGFELYLVIGVFTAATIGIIIRMKKKK